MKIREYQQIIDDIVDIELDFDSIGASRRSSVELQQKQNELKRLKRQINKDIKSLQSFYLRERVKIGRKYDSRQELSNTDKFLHRSKSKTRIKKMRKLENEKEKVIGEYKDMQYIIDDLIKQIDDIQGRVQINIKSVFESNMDI
jgi:hypothetical protein